MPSSSDIGEKLIPTGAAMMNLQQLRSWTSCSKQDARVPCSKPHTWIGSSSIPPRLVRLLMEVATNDTEPSGHHRFDPHYVSTALDTLEQCGDVSRDDLARLEFLSIRVLDHSEHGIRNLETQLSRTPALFMQALACAFGRNDGGKDPSEWQPSNSENRETVASDAYALLTTASRIPGTQADGSIDLEELKEWLKQVRILTREYGRTEIGDQMIGQLFCHCPIGASPFGTAALPVVVVVHAITGMVLTNLFPGFPPDTREKTFSSTHGDWSPGTTATGTRRKLAGS